MTELFNTGAKIISRLEENNYEGYFVGGAVRDYMLGRTINDVDITTNALPDTIEYMFDKTIDVGKEHGTIIVLMDGIPFEVTTYRIEGNYSDHRKPDNVYFTQNLMEDLSRRDFTINAMAMGEDREIFDPFEGELDLKKRLIQTVGIADERFSEDALRMLRAVRFMSQLDFKLSEATEQAVKSNAGLLKYVAVERITAELEKLYSGINVQHAKMMIAGTKLQNYIPFFNELSSAQYIAVEAASLENDIIVHIYNDISLEKHLSLLKLPNKTKRFIKQSLSLLNDLNHHLEVKLLAYYYDADILNNLNDIIKKNDIIDNDAKNDLRLAIEETAHLIIRSKSELAIDGNQLMTTLNMQGGPWVRKCLEAIELEVLFGRIVNTEKELINWVNTHVKNEDGNIIFTDER